MKQSPKRHGKNFHLLTDILKKTEKNIDDTVIHAIYPVAFLSIYNHKINKEIKDRLVSVLKIPTDNFLRETMNYEGEEICSDCNSLWEIWIL